MSILKVFGSEADAAYIRDHARLIEPYDAFLLVEADEKQTQALAKQYPVEDITDQYQLTVNNRSASRVKPRAMVADKQPAIPGTDKLSPGAHHYIVQFIGPIKQAWLAKLRATGARLRTGVRARQDFRAADGPMGWTLASRRSHFQRFERLTRGGPQGLATPPRAPRRSDRRDL